MGISKSLEPKHVEQVLRSFILPHLQLDALSSKALKNITITESQVSVTIRLGFPIGCFARSLTTSLQNVIQSALPEWEVAIRLESEIVAHAIQGMQLPVPQVKNIIAVASGKGGVGKSTVAVNLALSLAGAGARVGIVDADIYGPSIPRLLGLQDRPEITEDKRLKPVCAYGLQTISMGLLMNEDTPIIWRGPMVSSGLQQLIRNTAWDNLDYLFIDLPPGTGDIHLTLGQKIPTSGAIIVTTPQDLALIDARKGLELFTKVNIPLLGIVENMSGHRCRHCGHEQAIFVPGEIGAENLAQACNTEWLGKIPLNAQISQQSDLGQPIVAAAPQSLLAEYYENIALRLAAKLSLRPKNLTAKMPPIVIEKT